MDFITSLSSQVMNKALDGLAMRHNAIVSNLANVDTPNYHRRNVDFEQALSGAIQKEKPPLAHSDGLYQEPLQMQATYTKHFNHKKLLEDFQPQFSEESERVARLDGNSVDVESEMASLARNTQRYLALTNLQSRSLKSLRSVIQGG
jgi:flagellar basal-body rod protein FlgB